MKHKKLSNASLKKVWDWCEANEGTPLAEAYMGACAAVGMLDIHACFAHMKDHGASSPAVIRRETAKVYDSAFIHRDTVGRVILDMLNRKEKAEQLRRALGG